MYLCGWCGALNERGQLAQPARSTSPTQGGRLRRAARGASAAALSAARWAVVAAVTAMFLTIISAGVTLVLPRICHASLPCWALHGPIALFLSAQVTFNYAAAVLNPAGRVADCVPKPKAAPGCGSCPPGAFEGFMRCRQCAGPKPPGTHHCRACRTCVVDMDHHCPFLNNCVGRANQRNFLLFLAFTSLSTAYVMSMCSLVVAANWHDVRAAVDASAFPHGSASDPPSGARAWVLSLHTRVVVTCVFLIMHAEWWLLASYYLLVVSAAALLAVSALLAGQLRYLSRGLTYIDALQGRGAGGAGNGGGGGDAGSGGAAAAAPGLRKLWMRLQEVFGGSNVLLWPALRWRPLPSALLGGAARAKKAA